MRCTVTIDAPKWKVSNNDGTERERRAGQQYRDNEFAAILKQAADKIANTNAHEGTFTREEISGSYKFEE
jgi:hypothetical protein